MHISIGFITVLAVFIGSRQCTRGTVVFEEPMTAETLTNYAPRALADAYIIRGYNHYRASRYDDALADFQEAARIDPNYAFTYYWQGKTLEKLHHSKKALIQYQKVITIDSSFYAINEIKKKIGK